MQTLHVIKFKRLCEARSEDRLNLIRYILVNLDPSVIRYNFSYLGPIVIQL